MTPRLEFGRARCTVLGPPEPLNVLVIDDECLVYAGLVGPLRGDSGNRLSVSELAEPDFHKALCIAIAAIVTKIVAALVIALVASGGDLDARASEQAQQVASLLSSLIAFLGLAGALALILPTNFGKAILLAVLYVIIALVVIGIPLVAGSALIR